MKKQLGNEEIVKMIERQQVISYKKKNQVKQTHKQSKQDEEDFQSAQSLKSNVFSDDSVRFYKKNTPLPQLSKDRRRILGKGLISLNQHKSNNNYFEKEVRQHDNLVLKQQNNFLTTENMKLKTKLMTLEKQNARLQKLLEQDPQKSKVQPTGTNNLITRDQRNFRQGNSTKVIVRSLKKELDEMKKENAKIKWSVKFTRINELQIQRDNILQQTTRLRLLLDEQLGKRAHLKLKQHGISHMEQKLITLQQKNTHLMKQNQELSMKLKKTQQNSKKVQKISQNEKNLNKMLFNARRVIRQKEKQIQNIRSQGITSVNDIPLTQKNIGEAVSQSMKETNKVSVIANKNSSSKEKRVMSKSAQKYRSSTNKNAAGQECQNCKKLIEQIKLLQKKIEELSLDLKQQKQKSSKKVMGEISKDAIIVPSKQNISIVCKFISYRFKAHHLTLQEAQKYLINNENSQQQLAVADIVQSLIAQPFSVISNQYLDAFIYGLVYDDYIPDQSNKVTLDENKKISKAKLVKNFRKLIPGVQLMPQARQQQMFIQIAQLITNYHQHILTALNGKRNGEGTISQNDLAFFFNEIELEKQYVDFIITQIILESFDLEHLNYYAMFEIFYMPTQDLTADQGLGVAAVNNKKKFEVDHVVKEQDQQYEQSRSYVEAKQKTLSKRDDDQQYRASQSKEQNQNKSENHQQQQEYQQLFQEQKMNRVPQQEKTNQNHKPYDMQEQKPYEMQEQYAQDYEN